MLGKIYDDLKLEPEQRDSTAGADEQPDVSARLATAGLARTRGGEEPPKSDESDREEEPIGRRGKPVAWRNGRAVIGVGS